MSAVVHNLMRFDAPTAGLAFSHWRSHQRLLLSALLALLLHLVLVFGVSFESDPVRPRASLPTLEILLTRHPPSQPPPEEAEFLSQENHQTATEAPEKPEPPVLDEMVSESIPLELAPEPEPIVVKPAPPPKPTRTPVVVQKQKKPAPRAASLLSRSLAMAQLSAEVEDGVNSYARLPRQRHISARTQEYKYAAYMEAWVKKVERMGNLNYPAQARKDNLTGSLILDVCLRPDGSIESIDFIKSSGFDVLDDAAVDIVRRSAPYAEFPEDIRADTDLLHITRTWQFVRGNRLSGN